MKLRNDLLVCYADVIATAYPRGATHALYSLTIEDARRSAGRHKMLLIENSVDFEDFTKSLTYLALIDQALDFQCTCRPHPPRSLSPDVKTLALEILGKWGNAGSARATALLA